MGEKYGRARQATDYNIILCMHIACWITKDTDTHLEYVILIAFLCQPWLRKHTSMLRLYTRRVSCMKLGTTRTVSIQPTLMCVKTVLIFVHHNSSDVQCVQKVDVHL
jgi:hypothetical protein